MTMLLMIIAVIGLVMLLFKPLVFIVAGIIFVVKTFGKAILFYMACIASFYLTQKIGLADKFPPITTAQAFWCVTFAILTPIYFSFRKTGKEKK